LRRFEQVVVIRGIDTHLVHGADVETRNRKPMQPNPLADWELRLGDMRVYYDVEYEPSPFVLIHAVGVKKRNIVAVGGEEIAL
jgi:hypothetical protein